MVAVKERAIAEEEQIALTATFGERAPVGFKDAFDGLDFPVSEENLLVGYPDTQSERHQYFRDILVNPDFETYDVDFVSNLIGDTGNELALSTLDAMADISSGELGLMHRLERDVDESYLRLNGSLSKNLSEAGQMKHELLDMPVIGKTADDLDIAVAAIYEQLERQGVSHLELNQAMAASLKNPQDGIGMFYDLADKNNIPLTDYIMGVDGAMANVLQQEGVKNIRPTLDSMESPQLAVAAPQYVYENDGPRQTSPGFG